MVSLKLRAILFPFQMEPRREMLLQELGEMWDEIGEGEEERREMLHALEEECLNVYRLKAAQVKQHRAQLQREIADSVAEVAAICATIGEPLATVQTACSSLQSTRNLKEELSSITPELKEMRRRRDERRQQFLEVTELINRMHEEMKPSEHLRLTMDNSDLTIRRLEELRSYMQNLQQEKESRTRKMAELMGCLHSSSSILGIDFKEKSLHHGDEIVSDISDDAITRLVSEIERLREIKRNRMQKLQDLVATMLELWNLMDTPSEEQKRFQSVACNIAASEDEITEPNALSMDFINNVEAEVVRLENLKECRMKDLVLKKYDELNEIRRRAHIPIENEGNMMIMFDAIDSDAERSLILERLEVQISEAKDEEFSRKDVLERMERWQAALEEESWLEEYNRNENRYNVGKGTHLVLKRAEKARALVGKMPEALITKIVAWEKERGAKLEYDGDGLLDMLEEYNNTRKEKEQERKRQRDQRRMLGQGMVESPVARPPPKNIKNVTRTLSMGGSSMGSKKALVSASASSRPSTPSFLKSPMSARRSDEGQILLSRTVDEDDLL
ncbi:65-kDa microtubule-associated protein 3 isoform X2 [Oryza brachyantha]|uniref:65-kDa microtubule-associated protein 3 isoform X2 n=1 Tax=Oryza brachyantha TaxID=4533 RepID=UPI0007763B46|nr:65-kDa microtubule-associated protein 3 isoform X2 [Oryza brachyantha]